MKHRIFHRIITVVVVIPLFIVLTTTPAHAVFGSILAGIQRALDDLQPDHSNLQRHHGEDHV